MKTIFTKTKHNILILLIAISFGVQVTAPVAYAASCPPGRGILGLPTWWRNLDCGSDNRPAIGSFNDVWKIGLNVIEAAMIIAGYVAVGYVIWGGFKYLTSDGDEGRLKSARQIITNSLIGLMLVFASVAMVNFVAGLI